MSRAWDPRQGGKQPKFHPFDAIWDTGATNSVITQKVIDKCGLVATGIARVRGVHGVAERQTYLVNIALPGKVVAAGVRVTIGEITGADVLIGMDIINRGDFTVTNYGGITKFSYRIPSQGHIDFVKEMNQQAKAQQKAQPKQPSRAERRRQLRKRGKKSKEG